MPSLERLMHGAYFVGIFVVGAYVAALVIYFIARMVFGDRYWFIAFLNNISLYLLAPLPISVLAALLLGQSMLIAISGLLLIGAMLWLAPYLLPRSKRQTGSAILRVLTFNLWGKNPRQEQVVEWLRSITPDIVFLQEVPDSFAANAMCALQDLYPYQYRSVHPDSWWANVVLSRYPINAVTDLDVKDHLPSTRQRLEIVVHGRTIALYSIHLTYAMRPSRIRTNWSPLQAAARYDDLVRNQEIECLLSELERESLPFITAGDFNMSAQAVTYRKLVGRMYDAFLEAGYGFGGTWPIAEAMSFPRIIPPLMRIDYIWHSRHFRAIKARVGPNLGSDHLPVYAELEIAS